MRPTFHRSTDRAARRQAGVTLIELIVVITITGILAAVIGSIIMRPVESYQAQKIRAGLVDAAEMSLRRITRDIHQALPNSVRVDASGQVIEMINTVDGARYRAGPGVDPNGDIHVRPDNRLTFNSHDGDGFNIIGTFANFLPTVTGTFDSSTSLIPYRLAIYNQGVPGADAYADASLGLGVGPYVITNPAVTTFTIGPDTIDTQPAGPDEQHITPSNYFYFHWDSPNQRVFIVDTPVTYICSPGASGTITRYWNYNIVATQPTNPAATPLSTGSNALLTTPVTACSFSYSPGTNQRAGLVTLDITVADVASGNQVRLLYQVHVDNAP